MGLSIWTMHFVAMLALELGLAVRYDPGLIGVALVAAVISSAAAFLALRARQWQLAILVGGTLAGVAICAMHYTAMTAMRLPARIAYDPKLVIFSFLVAGGLSKTAYLLVWHEARRKRQLLAAGVLALAIVGMHYVAMAGTAFLPLAGASPPVTGIGSRLLAYSVVVATLMLLLMGQAAASLDRRLGASEARFLSLGTNMRGIVFRRATPRDGRLGPGRLKAQLFGRDAARITGIADTAGRLDMTRWRQAIHPEDLDAYCDAERRLLERHEPFVLDYRITDFTTGETRWIHETAWVVEDTDGGMASFDGCLLDRTEQKRVEAALRESEESHRRLVEAAPVAILTYADWRCTYANPRAVRLLGGRSADDLLGRPILDLVDDEAFQTMRRDLAAGPRDAGDAPTWELACTRRNGTRFPAEGAAVAIRHRQQPAVQLVLVDLSERKQAERAQALLIDELNHRVKNILATIDAMVSFTAAGATSAEELGATLAGRIGAIAGTHDLLTSGRWEGVGLRDIVERELRPFVDGAGVDIAGEELRLAPKAGLSLSLVLHELTTNAVKHGALGTDSGRVRVVWSTNDHRLRLTWEESDGLPVAPPTRRGFGTTLIERTTVQDLGGRSRLSFDAAGLRCELECPLDRILAKADGPARADDGEGRAGLDAEAVLKGSRVLVVEDEVLVTMVIEHALVQAGAELVGPATNLAEAIELARAEALDAAVLDVNINDEPVFPVADCLRERGVPFLFATGYTAETAIPPHHRDQPRLTKPYRGDRLRQMLAQAMAQPGQGAGRAAG
jgi:PAS domain S-box-containing protein